MKRFALLSLVASVVFVSSAQAAVGVPEYKHEITTPSLANFSFGGGNKAIGIGDAGGFTAGFSYNYVFAPGIEIGLFPTLSWVDTAAGSATTYKFLAGPTINFPMDGDLGEAIFLNGKAGVAKAGTTEFAFGFTLGKRCRITDHVSYRPSFSIEKVGSGSALFTVDVLAFSILL